MIFGVGTDIVELERIETAITRFGMAFAYKILHAREQEIMPAITSPKCVSWLAARFAAKEAVSKALGTGLRQGISFKNIAVLTNHLGKPELVFFDKSLEFVQKNNIIRAHISLSHERKNAIAFAVLETNDTN